MCWKLQSFGLLLACSHIVHLVDAVSTDPLCARDPSGCLMTPPMPKSCGLVMAKSTLPDSGMGVFALKPFERGVPVTPGDVAIQVVDITPSQANHMRRLLHDYLWHGYVTGGMWEGQVVLSSLPGVGMLANSLPQHLNVVPHKATYDGSFVHDTPQAGAVTYYRDFSFFTYKEIREGDEIFVDYGTGYFGERDALERSLPQLSRSSDWLRQNGVCLDNIATSDSRYGAVATRDLPVHSIVAPVPVAPLRRAALEGLHKGNSKQLLLNYCFGHKDSSLLLHSYAPLVNLVNHADHHASDQIPNVELRWSRLNRDEWLEWPIDKILAQNSSGLILELVAIRDISKGDEILLDYGTDWQEAWDHHVQLWKPPDASKTPSYAMSKEEPLRTVQEQQENPYPPNLVTSCYYRYADNRGLATAEWNSFGLGPHHLRPCYILSRQGSLYTVQIGNRPQLDRDEVVQERHLVTNVPREAIQFSDKTYTTDQHLENAFRHEIRLSDAIFPQVWKDLLNR